MFDCFLYWWRLFARQLKLCFRPGSCLRRSGGGCFAKVSAFLRRRVSRFQAGGIRLPVERGIKLVFIQCIFPACHHNGGAGVAH